LVDVGLRAFVRSGKGREGREGEGTFVFSVARRSSDTSPTYTATLLADSLSDAEVLRKRTALVEAYSLSMNP
jgi:hypothetical protein